MNLVEQIKQFFKPFPTPGSWAYRIQTWWYDRQSGGAVSEDFSIEPSGEAVENGTGNGEGFILNSDVHRGSGDGLISDRAVDCGDSDGDPSIDADDPYGGSRTS